MKTKSPNFLAQNRNILLLALAVALILLLPLLAMQFTDSVDWSATDFIFAGALLFGTGLAYELVARKGGSTAYRAALGAALATALLLVWTNLAVGIIGSEDNPANMLYMGVIAFFVVGTLVARFRAGGMARLLFLTALAQGFVTLIALVIEDDPVGFMVLVLNGFFVALWVGSALLFRRADGTPNKQLN